jgi:hypothetical protein
MELHDYDAERALADLIDRATSQRQDAVDPDLLRRIKSTCKSSEAVIRTVYDLLYTRLKKPNSQVRLLALEISAELFHRSALFRSLLAKKFPHFLGLVLGFKTNEPLPPPTDVAGRLRQRALELIETWHSEYSTRYPQVALGYSYIRETLRFEFPQLDARREAAEASAREREARAQEIAQQRYQTLLAEWQGQAVECRSFLNQFSEAFELLNKYSKEDDGDVGDKQHQLEEEDDDEQGWEDVAEVEKEAARTSQDGANAAAEGLSAYAAMVDEQRPDVSAQTNLENTTTEIDSAQESVIETLDGLYKLICSQALPGVQDALRIIIRAEAGTPGEAQHAQRERLLRAATSIKTELAAAKERFEGAHLDLAAMAQAQARRREEQEKKKKEEQEKKKKQKQKKTKKEEKTEPESINPYQFIRDPAAPLKPFFAPGRGDCSAPTHQRTSSSIPIAPHLQQKLQQQKSQPLLNKKPSQLPEAVRQSLASRAPVLPAAAPFIRVWDSNNTDGSAAPQFINSNGLEVANHWGPVDVHTELPSERMEELFLYAPVGNIGGGNVGGGRDTSGNEEETRRKKEAPPGRRAAAGAATAATKNNTKNNSGVDAGVSLLHGEFIPSTTTEARRAQRAAERAYNDAVISAAATGADEALAHALQYGGSTASGSEPQQNKGRKKRKAGGATAKERLGKKLLSTIARNAALADTNAAENERQREKFSNRWENR